VIGGILQGRETLLGKYDGFDESFGHNGTTSSLPRGMPKDLASGFQKEGRLEDAAQAWEVAMGRSAQEEDWFLGASGCGCRFPAPLKKASEVVSQNKSTSITGPKDSAVLQNHDLY